MSHQLSIQIFGDLSNQDQGNVDDSFYVQRRKSTEDLHRSESVVSAFGSSTDKTLELTMASP